MTRGRRGSLLLRRRFIPAHIAVGTALTGGPPLRSQRAGLPHWAPASGGERRIASPGRGAALAASAATDRRGVVFAPWSGSRAGCGAAAPVASATRPVGGTP